MQSLDMPTLYPDWHTDSFASLGKVLAYRAIAGRASFHHFVLSGCTAFAVIPKFEGM